MISKYTTKNGYDKKINVQKLRRFSMIDNKICRLNDDIVHNIHTIRVDIDNNNILIDTLGEIFYMIRCLSNAKIYEILYPYHLGRYDFMFMFNVIDSANCYHGIMVDKIFGTLSVVELPTANKKIEQWSMGYRNYVYKTINEYRNKLFKDQYAYDLNVICTSE
jgi:hypothetical protein